MTNPVTTVVHHPARNTEGVPAPAVGHQTDQPGTANVGDFFENDAWAEEFERRLAAWEAESRLASPATDATPR